MKYFGVYYYDRYGIKSSVLIMARNIKSARNKFIRDYGYHIIIMVKEVNL